MDGTAFKGMCLWVIATGDTGVPWFDLAIQGGVAGVFLVYIVIQSKRENERIKLERQRMEDEKERNRREDERHNTMLEHIMNRREDK